MKRRMNIRAKGTGQRGSVESILTKRDPNQRVNNPARKECNNPPIERAAADMLG